MSSPVFLFDGSDPQMQHASEEARRTFKYFWRELSWERNRIVPALDMAMVKLPFTDGPRTDGHSEWEHMWIDNIAFDGETLSGILLNSPHWLTSVRKGQRVEAPFQNMEDWMMTANDRAYGAFTVNVMRARMGKAERQDHDNAWGLDFGDPSTVRLELKEAQKPKPGFFAKLFGASSSEPKPDNVFSDHPMCINMLAKIEEQLKSSPSIATDVDQRGWTILHKEALAGNLGVVKLLVKFGANTSAKTPSGKTAADLARSIGWVEVSQYLDTAPSA